MTINAKREKVEMSHKNFMNGKSYNVSPFIRLQMVAASCFMGEPQYYKKAGTKYSTIEYIEKVLGSHSTNDWKGLNSVEIIEKTIDECLSIDVEKTLIIAESLRVEDYMRETPQVILVRAAVHKNQKGTGLVNKYGLRICIRGDEPATGLAYLLKAFGRKSIPNSLKKVWKSVLESLTDYEIAKYKMGSREVRTIDVVRICHANSASINKLMSGNAKEFNTYRSIISNSDNSTSEAREINWRKVVEKSGHMALLRNIRNFVKNGIPVSYFSNKLKNGVLEGKQFPFRYYNAMIENNGNGYVKNCLEECMDIAINNMPKFEGRVMSLCDNSGSATSSKLSTLGNTSVSTVANLMGIITAKCFSKGGQLGLFGDKLSIDDVNPSRGVLSTLQTIEEKSRWVGGGTEHGAWLFWDYATKNNEHYDYVFVYSDMQAGHGGLYGSDNSYINYIYPGTRNYIDIPKLISEYRKKVNPNVKVFLVQVAGYEDTLIPEFYKNTYILGGWSENILKFAKKMEQIKQY
ncbi:MAG: hypothetical protein M0P71_01705 [Melioribacteraceae bacterium]|nr:hypothetical protein [Melioribacteraceae bacterium]